jgi:T5SS/PEP-CTERM-associated repeat protein
MFAVLAMALVAPQVLVAQTTFTWVGPSGGFWDEAVRWSPGGGPPGAIDIASFSNNFNHLVRWDDMTGNRQIGRLSVTAGTYRIQNSGTSQHVLTLNSNAFNAFEVSGASTTLTLAGLRINAVNGGGVLSSGATLTLEGNFPNGARLSLSQNFSIDGTLDIQLGGEVNNSAAGIGANFGSTGMVNVTGVGSKWTNSGDLFVGGFGTGTLNVQNGGVVTNAVGFIGNGTVTVTGAGSNWTNSSTVEVGRFGTGTLNVQNGGVVTNTFGDIGVFSAGIGTATVTGAGSKWTNLNSLDVGKFGTGTLNVQNGGEVTSAKGAIGAFSGSIGTATVTGTGSKWTNSGNLEVGRAGTGTLSVQNGGEVTNVNGVIGDFSSGNGTVTVTGAGSKWTNSGNLEVGREGTGTLNINNNGVVSVGGNTSINAASAVNLNGGRFEFGTTDKTSFNRINAVSGSLAGHLNVFGLNAASSFTLLTNSAVNSSEVNLINFGTLHGDGLLGSRILNTSDGEIRTVNGQWMRFAGPSNVNAGEINNFGGTIEFQQDLTNFAGGFIAGRGVFAANGGWTNNGVMAFSGGFADVLGDVANGTAGIIAIAGGSTTTFYDDVVMSAGNLNVNVSQNSNAVFFGSYNGGSNGPGTVHTFGDLRPGNSAASVSFGGDLIMGASTFTEIELGGLSSGMFDQLLVAGDLHLNGLLDVQLIDGFTLGFNQTFDVGVVNGSLFGQFSNFNNGDLVGNFGGVDLFIGYHSGGAGGNGFSLFTAIPEPSSAILLMLGTVAYSLRRRRMDSRA